MDTQTLDKKTRVLATMMGGLNETLRLMIVYLHTDQRRDVSDEGFDVLHRIIERERKRYNAINPKDHTP